jgi:hypothetical protein
MAARLQLNAFCMTPKLKDARVSVSVDRLFVLATLLLVTICSETSRAAAVEHSGMLPHGLMIASGFAGSSDVAIAGEAMLSGAGTSSGVRTWSQVLTDSNNDQRDKNLLHVEGPQKVPDGGVTLILLGIALVILEALRRKLFS